jgi:leucyl-tRNA synthetase
MDRIPDGSGNPLHKHEAFMPAFRPVCASPPAAKPTRWTSLSTVHGISCAIATPRTVKPWWLKGAEYWMPMDQYIGGIERDSFTRCMRVSDQGDARHGLSQGRLFFTKLPENAQPHLPRRPDKRRRVLLAASDVEHMLDDTGRSSQARPQASLRKVAESCCLPER